MDTSADAAAWVAAIAAVASLGIVLWQVFGARSERIRQHDIETLERMLTIVTDPQVAGNTPWSPTLFMGLYVSLSGKSKGFLKTLNNLNPGVVDLKAELARVAAHVATDLLTAIRARMGLTDDDWTHGH